MTIRLGWLPSSIDHSHPADRRRLGWFLNEIDAEIFETVGSLVEFVEQKL